MRYFTPYWKRGLSIEQYMNDTERTFWPDPLGQPDWNVEQYRTVYERHGKGFLAQSSRTARLERRTVSNSIEQYMNDTERAFWPKAFGQRTLGIEKRISRACRTDNPNRSVSDER